MEVKLDNGAKMPTYGTGYSAGMDLYSTESHAGVNNLFKVMDKKSKI